MSGYTTNSSVYNIHTENEAMQILSHFETGQIIDIIEDSISKRFGLNVQLPNIVNALEQDFKNTSMNYPENIADINNVRTNTYNQVIAIIERTNNVSIQVDDFMDMYSVAYHLYDFFVSNYKQNIINFFTNFIIRERNNIYNSMHLEEYKKNRDSTTLYGKKMYKNTKLAVINACLEYIVDNICEYDFDIQNILNFVYEDKLLAQFLGTIIQPRTDIFKTLYVSAIRTPELRLDILSSIRLNIHYYSSQQE